MATIVNGLTNLLLIPVIILAAGAPGWASIAAGQAAGMIGAIISGLGWGVTGPASVAALSPHDRPRYFASSLVMRLGLLVPAAALVVIVCLVLPLSDPVAAILSGLAAAAYGVGATWFFVGTSRPSLLLACDTLPRVASVAAGAALLVLGLPLWMFALSQLLGAVISVVVSAVVVLGRARMPWRSLLTARSLKGSLAGQGSAVLVGVSSLYLTMPVIVVTALVPAGAAAFALADRILKLSSNALLPVQQVFQGWVPSAPPGQLTSRVSRAVRAAVGLGLVAATGVALLGPFIGGILGAGLVELSLQLSVPIGIAIGISTVTQCTGTACLVALGRVRAMGLSALFGAGVGLPLIVLFTYLWGGPGAAWAIVIAEATVLTYQGIILSGELKNRRLR